MPPCCGSNAHQSPTERTNSSRVTMSAIRLALRSSPSTIGTTPASGSSTRAWRIHRSNEMQARSWLIGSSLDHGVQHPQGAYQEEHHVHPDLTRLEPAADPSETAGELGRSVHRRAVHHALIHAAPEDIAGEPDQWADDEAVVKLVHVILVVQDTGQARVGGRLSRGQ